jgi:hypothetical protein
MPKKPTACSRRTTGTTTAVLVAVALAIAPGVKPKEYLTWVNADEHSQKLSSDEAENLRSEAKKMIREITSLQGGSRNLFEVLKIVRSHGAPIQGMVTNGNTVGLTTDEYSQHRASINYRMLITVPISEEDLEKLKNMLPNGQDIAGDDKVYFYLKSLV